MRFIISLSLTLLLECRGLKMLLWQKLMFFKKTRQLYIPMALPNNEQMHYHVYRHFIQPLNLVLDHIHKSISAGPIRALFHRLTVLPNFKSISPVRALFLYHFNAIGPVNKPQSVMHCLMKFTGYCKNIFGELQIMMFGILLLRHQLLDGRCRQRLFVSWEYKLRSYSRCGGRKTMLLEYSLYSIIQNKKFNRCDHRGSQVAEVLQASCQHILVRRYYLGGLTWQPDRLR